MEKGLKNNYKFLILFFAFTALLGYTSCESSTSKAKKVDQSEIIQKTNSFLDQWHVAAAEANYNNYFGKMDSISIFIGTDAGENWNKKQFEDFSKPYFDKGKAWSFKAIERNVYTNEEGTFIWFDELLSTWMGLCRGSGVLEMKNNQLTIKHYVLSVTISNEKINEFLKIKKDELDTLAIK